MKFNRICSAVVAGAMVLPVASISLAQGQQTQERQQQRSQTQAQQGQAGQRGMARQADQKTQQILASDIKLGNEAEIQLSQLGQRQAQSQEVKQYAQQMIQAHQQLNQELVQAVPQARQASLQGAAGRGTGAAAQPRERSAATGQTGQAGQAGQTGRAGQAGEDVYGMAAGADQADTLTTIHQQVVQNMLEQQQEMLKDKQGAEFDKAFMGCQIGLHQAMLAKLQVYQDHVSDDAQEVLQQAEQETRQHLEEAKQIMEQLASASQ